MMLAATERACSAPARAGSLIRSCRACGARWIARAVCYSTYSLAASQPEAAASWRNDSAPDTDSKATTRSPAPLLDSNSALRIDQPVHRADQLASRSRETVDTLLQHWLDKETTLRTLAVAAQTAKVVTLEETCQLVKKLVAHLARHRMIAILPTLLAIWTEKVDDILRDEGLADLQQWEELQWYYTRILQVFWTFGRFSELEPATSKDRSTPLPLSVRIATLDLMCHLLKLRDTVPTSSRPDSRQPQLGGRLARTLLIPRFMTPELRDLVVENSPHRELGKTTWWWCLLSAHHQGNSQQAKRYKRLMDAASSRAQRDSVPQPLSRAASHPDQDPVIKTADPLSPMRAEAGERALAQAAAYSTIDQILQARAGLSIKQFMEFMRSHLGSSASKTSDPADESDTAVLVSQYAWSNLLYRTAGSKTHGADDLLELYNEVPDHSLIARTATPVIQGLSRMGNHSAAWGVWEDLVSRHWTADGKARHAGKWVDRVSLGSVIQASYDQHGLEATITLVDDWARRPAEHPARKLRDTITLDAQNVNLLLDLCKRSGAPSIAFRLWEAALPRWGVWLDAVSLNILLDTVRFANVSGDRNDTPLEARMKHLKSELRLFPRQETTTSSGTAGHPASHYTEGDASRLLDPIDEGYTWMSEFGRIKPWEKARLVFRDVMLGNWPFLADIASPLDLHGGIILKDFQTVSGPSALPPAHARVPHPAAPYPHIMPNALSFQSYIRLLGHFHLTAEIPLALAWMRALGITPTYNTMSAALLSIQEEEGPRRLIRGWGPNGRTALVSDGELVRRWLLDWLGDGEWPEGDLGRTGRVPSDDDLGAFRRTMMEKGETRM